MGEDPRVLLPSATQSLTGEGEAPRSESWHPELQR